MTDPSVYEAYTAIWYISQTWTVEHMMSNLKLGSRQNCTFDRFLRTSNRGVMRECLRIISKSQIRKVLHANLTTLIFEGEGNRQGGEILFNTLLTSVKGGMGPKLSITTISYCYQLHTGYQRTVQENILF